MILPGSTTEYCQAQKHDHLQTRQFGSAASVLPLHSTQRSKPTEAPLTKVIPHTNSEGLVQRPAFADHRHGNKITQRQTNRHMIFSKERKKKTGNKFPEIWLLHLPAKVSRDWGTGKRQRRPPGRATAAPRSLPQFWNQRAVIGRSCRSCLRDLRRVSRSVGGGAAPRGSCSTPQGPQTRGTR